MSFVDIFSASLAEIFGDFSFKDFARGGGPLAFGKGMVGYAGVIFFLIKSLRVGNVAYVNGMWDGISGLIETLAAIFIFGEKLNGWIQYVGLAMIIGGTFCLHSGGIPYN
jgi:multidrug transporter EmrE-like cation transporter